MGSRVVRSAPLITHTSGLRLNVIAVTIFRQRLIIEKFEDLTSSPVGEPTAVPANLASNAPTAEPLRALIAGSYSPGAILRGTGNPQSRFYRSARTAVVAAHAAREHVVPPRARGRGYVPATPAAVTNQWLTEVLCRDVPGSRVIWSETEEVSTGSSTRWKTGIRYNNVGAAADLPTTVFHKRPSDSSSA